MNSFSSRWASHSFDRIAFVYTERVWLIYILVARAAVFAASAHKWMAHMDYYFIVLLKFIVHPTKWMPRMPDPSTNRGEETPRAFRCVFFGIDFNFQLWCVCVCSNVLPRMATMSHTGPIIIIITDCLPLLHTNTNTPNKRNYAIRCDLVRRHPVWIRHPARVHRARFPFFRWVVEIWIVTLYVCTIFESLMTTFNGILHFTAHSTHTTHFTGTWHDCQLSPSELRQSNFYFIHFPIKFTEEKGSVARYSFRSAYDVLRAFFSCMRLTQNETRFTWKLHFFTYCFRKRKEPIEQIVVVCPIIDEFHYIHTCICLRLHGWSSWIMDYEPKMPGKKFDDISKEMSLSLTLWNGHTHTLALKDDPGYRL